MLAIFACRGYKQTAQTPKCLHWAAYPGDDATMAWCWPATDTGARVIDGQLTQAKNEVDCLTFTLYPNNPGYDYLNEYGTLIYAVDSDEPETAVFAGRVIAISPFSDPDGATGKAVTCEGGLGFLRDVNYGVSASDLTTWPKAYNLLDNLGKRYNAGVGSGSGNWNILNQTGVSSSNVLFYIHKVMSFDLSAISSSTAGHGISEQIAASSLDIFTSVCNNNNWVMLYDRTLPQDANGFFEATNYLTIKPNGSVGTTRGDIEIGVNLGSSSYEAVMGNPATFGYAKDTSSGQNGFAASTSAEDYKTYGVITGGASYNEGLNGTQIANRAKSLINTTFDYSITATALDLSYIDADFDRFKLLDRWTVKNSLIGLNQTMQIVKRTVDLDEPWNSSIEFGTKSKSASQQQAATSSAVNMTGDNAVAITVFDGASSGVVPVPSSASSDLVLSAAGTWVSNSGGGGGVTDYDQLTSRPSINGVTLTGTMAATDIKMERVFFGTCGTAAATTTKSVTCSNFAASDLVAGTVVFVKFTYGNTASTTASLDVNGTGGIAIARVGSTVTTQHYWTAGELVCFVYDDANRWLMVDKGTASTTYYGLTKLSSSTSSTSTTLAATPSAVKAAYDLAAAAAPAASLATVATSGDYDDLDNKPAIPSYSTFTNSTDGLVPKPNLSDVDEMLYYMDADGVWNSVHEILDETANLHTNEQGYLNRYWDGSQAYWRATNLATVATSGSYSDLSGTPTIPSASSTTPAMDGTASAGSETAWAKGDHVHPTDTSRAASSHTHGSITNAGAITSDTSVASGDKLVIADSSDSSKLKRSGIAFGSSTSTYLRNDGTWGTPSGGGGGTSDYTDLTNKPQINSVTLTGNKSAADLSLLATSGSTFTDLTGDDASSLEMGGGSTIQLHESNPGDYDAFVICEGSVLANIYADMNGTSVMLPSGGTSGQVLAKASATDYDVGWVTPSGGGGSYAVTRFVPDTTSAQTLSTSAALVTSITTKELDTAGVTVSSNVYTLPSAGLWRITAQCGMYPNTTAKTRLSAGIYKNNASGTRLAIGIHEVYNLTANTASQVTTVMAQTVINAAANDKIAICAFADVTNAKLHKSDSSITNITFEKVG